MVGLMLTSCHEEAFGIIGLFVITIRYPSLRNSNAGHWCFLLQLAWTSYWHNRRVAGNTRILFKPGLANTPSLKIVCKYKRHFVLSSKYLRYSAFELYLMEWNDKMLDWHTRKKTELLQGSIVIEDFLPEASFRLRTLSLPASECLCVCVGVCGSRVCPYKLESPNLYQSCKRPWLRSLLSLFLSRLT